MTYDLNRRAALLVSQLKRDLEPLRVRFAMAPGGGEILDFGVESRGGLEAGLRLAEVCMAGLGRASLVPGEVAGCGWPHVQVSTDSPVAACLMSQYAGWQLSAGKFFAMGSGPMRAAAAREELFSKFGYREAADICVGVLEGGKLPTDEVFELIAAKAGVPSKNISLLVAPTSSQAGNVQVVARSVETALHKLFEVGFDVNRIVSGYGTAPLPPVAADDLTGIGRTNDAILYGGRVTLWVDGDDDLLSAIGPKVPALASEVYGKPFLEIFEDAGRDFYKIDPHLFSPAEIVFQNVDSGRVHRFGKIAPEVVRRSFGV